MTQEIFIPKLADKVLMKCMSEVSELIVEKNSITYFCSGLTDKTVDPKKYLSDEQLAFIVDQNSMIIDSFSFSFSPYVINFNRGGRTEPKSPFVDSILIRKDGTSAPNIPILKILALILQQLKAFELGRIPFDGKRSAQSELQAMHASTLDKLESVNLELTKTTHEYRNKLDDELVEKEKNLREQLDHERAIQEEKNQRINDELVAQAHALKLEKIALDDKSNTHARRQIRKDIIVEIKNRQEKFELTEGTNQRRLPIIQSMIALVIFFAGMLAITVYEIKYEPSSTKDIYALILTISKQILYSAGPPMSG